MAMVISKNDLFLITQVMNSQNDDSLYGYIDRETGEVLMGSRDNPLEILPNEDNENYDEAEIEFDRRYLPIPQQGSEDAYQDMVAFIETVENQPLRTLLEVAIQGRGAFSRFKDVLRRAGYETERNRWFLFSQQCENNRAVEWLVANGFSVEM